MNRLTHERCNGIKTGYWSAAKKDELIDRLAEYENTGLEPEEIKRRLDPDDEDFQSVLICAERYACGRRTYITVIVISFIDSLIPVLNDKTLAVLQRDIDKAMRNNTLGDPLIDAPGWIKLYEQINAEIRRRAGDNNAAD